jgi:hypothetical protein
MEKPEARRSDPCDPIAVQCSFNYAARADEADPPTIVWDRVSDPVMRQFANLPPVQYDFAR